VGVAGYLASSIPLRLASAGSAVALPILAVHELGDVAVGGALVAASLGPAVVAAPLAGVALDRARRPRLLVIGAAVATFGGFAAASLLGIVPLPVIVLLLVIAGCAAPFYFGGLSSFVTGEVAGEHRAYAYDALSYNISSVAGPGIVAIAAVSGSGRLGMWLMAGAALVGALGAFALRMRARPAVAETFLGTIAAGARHLTGHAPLRLVILSGGVSQFGAGALPIAAIALSIERAGSAADGAVIVTAFAVGGLAGAVLSTARPGSRFPASVVMTGGFALIGVLTLAAVPDLGLPWTIAVIGASGLFTASSSAAMLLLRKQQSPAGVRSQVFTIGSGLRAATGAAGAAVAGVVAGLDAGVLIAAIGVVWLLAAVVMLPYPRDAQPLEDPAAEPVET
jgi:hypothetical protein